MLEQLWKQPRNPKIAILLAVLGVVIPIGWPLVGLHKFYLKQPRWGLLYLCLFATPIPHIASAVDALWYLLMSQEGFHGRFNPEEGLTPNAALSPTVESQQVEQMGESLRQLEQLRQEGLLSEYEFEQKRRQLLGM